ncbi:uncharacterized protein LOC113849594 [Abrus precatorius]|uniref:Uncharacterized protein LOC113849594 n=1 Tax=Abrus precatorius TaxID=3816 RepID=A0A8B8JVP3_ABRPR|nr:uncharacterized protein LOC113849594 [Abrus precatorius]
MDIEVATGSGNLYLEEDEDLDFEDLAEIEDDMKFDVYCDMSVYGPECILMQDRRVFAYVSRQLRPHKVNYPTHDLELVTVVFALKQRRWIEFLKDYDFTLSYHPNKPNVVADALSKKLLHMAAIMVKEMELIEEFQDMKMAMKQGDDFLQGMMRQKSKGKDLEFLCDENGVIKFQDCVCILQVDELKQMILEEESGVSWETTLDCYNLWRSPKWKWDNISMDFVSGLPRTRNNHDAICVIVDRLTKAAHFLLNNMKYKLEKLTDMYAREIVRLHGVPSNVVSDRDPRFTSGELIKGVRH